MAAEPNQPVNGAHLFTFIAVADTHVNEAEDISTSPFETNHLANARARHVFAEIAAMDPQPEFVIHLGDIVHPMPSLPTYHEAAGHFKTIAKQISVPLHVIPGNHDVGDKTVDWMPAELVCDAYLEEYRQVFGQDYYAFDHAGVRFVLINSLLINSGLADEQRQADWLHERIESAGDLRVFVFMHYPPYVYQTNERGSYDNIDEPGRSWLLAELANPRVEAVFAGHVHNFWYDRIGSAEMYMLPSTAFLRHDYSEFASVAPEHEFGRADTAKFGIFQIDVYEHGHVAYALRSYGRQCADDGSREIPPDIPVRRLAHSKTSGFDAVGVELRHPWAEVRQISATGGVQEFGRKWARNDYPLLALWEMGVKLTKIPDSDLVDSEPRERMKHLADIGHRHIVTLIGSPREAILEASEGLGIVAYETNLTLARFEAQRSQLAAARKRSGASIYFAKILTDHDAHFDGKTFSHFVKSGFTIEELDLYADLVGEAVRHGEIDGITVRIDANNALGTFAPRLEAFREVTGASLLVSVKLAGPSVAGARNEDRETAVRAIEAMVLSRAQPNIRYVFDTFMDVDRGYYPRQAFIDRRFNPRLPANAFSALTALLPGHGSFDALEIKDSAYTFTTAGRRRCVAAGARDAVLGVIESAPGNTVVHDLLADRSGVTGTFHPTGEPFQAVLIELN